MAGDFSGIRRAIAAFGTQAALADELTKRTHIKIPLETVSRWATLGYVPGNYIPVVSEMSGVPAADLARQTPRKTRSDKGSRRTNGARNDEHRP